MIKLFEKWVYVSMKIRNWWWSKLFDRLGSDSGIYGKISVVGPRNIKIGNNSRISEGVFLNARTSITIGDYVHLSPFCIINTGGLDYEKEPKERVHTSIPVIIEDGVWICSGAIINPGVKIGKNSVIGAGAIVTKDIPENSVAVGVPARVVKTLSLLRS